MKKVLILGAGMVTKPMADYFLDNCKYHVVMATRTISKAEQIINNRSNAQAVSWTTNDHTLLDKLVDEVDIVMSMIPPTQHIPVAKVCLKYKKNMITASYLNPEMLALDKEAKESSPEFQEQMACLWSSEPNFYSVITEPLTQIVFNIDLKLKCQN